MLPIHVGSSFCTAYMDKPQTAKPFQKYLKRRLLVVFVSAHDSLDIAPLALDRTGCLDGQLTMDNESPPLIEDSSGREPSTYARHAQPLSLMWPQCGQRRQFVPKALENELVCKSLVNGGGNPEHNLVQAAC